MRFLAFFLLLTATFCSVACDYDQAPEPTISDDCATSEVSYVEGIEELMERTCAYEGCHISGFSSGDYTTYESIIPFVESIQSRTLLSQDMPPNYAPDGKAKSLTDEEKQLLECWIANGSPEE